MSQFPCRRMRRWRRTEALRALRRETQLHPRDLIYPLFVVDGHDQAGDVPSMPRVRRFTVELLDAEIETVVSLGLQAVLLFGIPSAKNDKAGGAIDEKGVVPRAISRIRSCTDRLAIFTDVCLCSYTGHGHCGVIQGESVANDATLRLLGQMAVAHAGAGADVVAPSGMMDGMVGAIRGALDEAGFLETAILSYAVKYASSYYGPFRDAAESTPAFGDRRSYQMDPANVDEALAEARLDLDEGADAIMVKPALPYLDVIARVKDRFPDVPLAAYQVSGEYSMIKAAAQQGWLNERAVVMESLTAVKRAGADMIITYFAKEAVRWIRESYP